jgi:exopolyphosphatase/guanosine-5'-triphosphate,3'-diphosphate pyrophosphatase
MDVVGAIDVGSNAIRLLVASLNGKNELEAVENVRVPIRLGSDVFSNRVIEEQTISRMEKAFAEFAATLKSRRASRVRAIGTSALREAANSVECIERVQRSSGITIEIISGDEEARLVYRAVREKVDLRSTLALLVDIGGGSVELSLVDDGVIINSQCLPLGTVRLLQVLNGRNHNGKVFTRLVREYARGVDQSLQQELRGRTVGRCVGTGGNVEELGALRMLGAKQATPLAVAELATIADELQSLSFEERREKLALKADRADVIVPASIVLLQVLQAASVKEIEIPGVGVKEGIALELLAAAGTEPLEPRRAQLVAFARELGRRYSFEEEHGTAVARHALSLFDQLSTLHELDHRYRLLLELGALLHDVGRIINYQAHHKHSFYILKETPFLGLRSGEQKLVASIARYHRKGAPKPDHDAITILDPVDREPLTKLAAILRIADALDRQHESAVDSVQVRSVAPKVVLALNGRGDLLLERWAVREKSKLFSTIFKCEVTLESEG